MVQTSSSLVLAAVVLGATSTMGAPTKGGHGKSIVKALNRFGPAVLEHGLPLAGQFIPPRQRRELGEIEVLERDIEELEVREPKRGPRNRWFGRSEVEERSRRPAGRAIVKTLNRFGPAVLEHGLPLVGQFIPPRRQRREVDEMEVLERDTEELEVREPKRGANRNRWLGAAINGGLDFASNAVTASKGRREVEERSPRQPTGRGRAIVKTLNRFGPAVLEHGLPLVGQFIPPRRQRREADEMEVLERDTEELEVREPKRGANRNRWLGAAINGGLDFASNAVTASKGRREVEERSPRQPTGRGRAIVKTLNRFGPAVLEHGLPLVGQFIPPRRQRRELDEMSELLERDFQERSYENLNTLD